MITMHEQLAIECVNERIIKEPKLLPLLMNTIKKIEDKDYFDKTTMDIICQNTTHSFRWDIYTAYSFLECYALFHQGLVKVFVFDTIYDTPRDKFIEKQNNNFNDINKNQNFDLKFWGGTRDEDGYFKVKNDSVFNGHIIKKVFIHLR